ncbi:MAG: type II secretion system protein [bacterium]
MLKKLGFTMIELLIVIAVLGILAVAVLSAINPIELINRGRDTGSKSDVEQVASAVDRYYTAKGYFPWVASAAVTPISTASTAVPSGFVPLTSAGTLVGTGAGVAMLTQLSTGGLAELKASFITRITATGYRTLKVYNNGSAGASTYLCFIPQSVATREEAWNRCNTTLPGDFPALACPADATCTTAATADAATGCHICLP